MGSGDGFSGAAAFSCRLCGGTAAVVSFAPTSTTPDGRSILGLASFHHATIRIDAGPLSASIGGQTVSAAGPAIVAALDAADAARLFAADEEYAPFWCPTCDASYCGEHWQSWLVLDPDDPGWFEEQRGRCPEGHERMLFD